MPFRHKKDLPHIAAGLFYESGFKPQAVKQPFRYFSVHDPSCSATVPVCILVEEPGHKDPDLLTININLGYQYRGSFRLRCRP